MNTIELNDFQDLLNLKLIDAEKRRIEIYRERSLADACFFARQTKKARDISLKNLNRAKKMHLHDCVVDFCRHLRYYYSVANPNARKAHFYHTDYRKHLLIKRVEEEMESLYCEWALTFGKAKWDQQKEHFVKSAWELLTQAQSYQICLRGYFILTSCYSGDSEQLLKCSQEALAYFESLAFYSKKPKEVFAMLALPALIEKKNYQRCLELVDKYQPNKKTVNHFNFATFKAITLLRSGKYLEAYGYLYNYSLNGAPDALKEQWEILKAFVHSLADLSGTKLPGEFGSIGKFLNSVEIWAKDKKGHNFNLILLEILLRYCRQDDNIHDRVDGFSRYIRRHKKQDNRNEILLKGLLTWINNNFSYDFELERELLCGSKPQEVDVEIIPYEDLIELVLAGSRQYS